jgi:hypothetical protein
MRKAFPGEAPWNVKLMSLIRGEKGRACKVWTELNALRVFASILGSLVNWESGYMCCRRSVSDTRIRVHWNSMTLMNGNTSWTVLSSWMWHYGVRFKFTDVSEECTALIFRVEDILSKQRADPSAFCLLLVSYLLGLFLDPEEGGSKFIWSVSECYQTTRFHNPDDTCSILHSHRCKNLKSNMDVQDLVLWVVTPVVL